MATLKNIYPPVPTTVRGEGIKIGLSPNRDRICYAAQGNVVVRSVDNLLDCYIYNEHRKKVTACQFAPSGYYIASGDENGAVRIWDTVGADHILKIEVNCFSGRVDDISWSEDSKRVCAVGDGQQTKGKVFSWDTGSNVGEISGHSKRVLSCDLKPTRPYSLATAGEDLLTNLYQGPPFRFSRSQQLHDRYPNMVRYSPDGNWLVSVGSDAKGHVYDAKTGDQVGQFSGEGHSGAIYSCSWSPDSATLYTSSADKTIKVWSMADGSATCTKTLHIAERPQVQDMQVCVAATASALLSVSLSGQINYWDANGADAPTRIVPGHQSPIMSLDVNAANGLMVSGDVDGRICVWNMADGTPQLVAGKTHTNAIVGAKFSCDGSSVLSVAEDDTVRTADCKTCEIADGSQAALDAQPACMAVGRSDPTLVVTGYQATVAVVRQGAVVHTFAASAEVTALALSPDDSELAVGCANNKVQIFALNAASGEAKESFALDKHRGKVQSLAYSGDGTMLASGDSNREIVVWDRAASPYAPKITGWQFHDGPVVTLSWSPQSDRLASGSLDMHVFIWSIAKKRQRVKIDCAHYNGLTSVVFYGDNLLASAGHDGVIRTWDLPDAPV